MKVSVIGAGNVGATLAKRIVENELADVVLLDVVKGLAEGKSLDLLHAVPILGHSKSIYGTDNYEHTLNSDVVIITAGLARKPGMSRDDLMQKNAKIVAEITKKVCRFSPNSIILMVTNPLDAMTYVAYKLSCFSSKKVIGMAGVLDSSRFAHLIGAELNIPSSSVETIVLGGHGDTMVPLLSQTKISGTPLFKLLSLTKINELVEKTRKAGAEIVNLLGSGSAYYAPSAAVFLMLRTILKDEKKVLPASVYLNGEYGLKGLCLGVPIKLGDNGVEEIIELELTEEEQKALKKSAEMTKKLIGSLEL